MSSIDPYKAWLFSLLKLCWLICMKFVLMWSVLNWSHAGGLAESKISSLNYVLWHHCLLCLYVFGIFRCCSQFVPCWRTQILMILWSPKLHTCTRQTGTSTSQLQEAGPRNMPWANWHREESDFYFQCLGQTALYEYLWSSIKAPPVEDEWGNISSVVCIAECKRYF